MTDCTVSRLWLNFNDEDYTDSVCLLLPGGHATLIDVAQFDFATKSNWKVMGRSIFDIERTPVTYVTRRCGIGRTGYGKFRVPGRKRMCLFHRELFLNGIPDSVERWNAGLRMQGKDIDHRNRNCWDNRWANLRIATESQNSHNAGPRRNKSSQYKGVSKLKGKDKWVAQITVRGKHHYLGTFDDEFKAAQAYNAAVRKLCPEFGYINPLSC